MIFLLSHENAKSEPVILIAGSAAILFFSKSLLIQTLEDIVHLFIAAEPVILIAGSAAIYY